MDTNRPLRLTNCRLDHADPFHQTSPLDGDQFEAEILVSLFVNFLKAHRVVKGDSARFGGRDKAEIANEEDSLLVDRLVFDTIQFSCKKG